MSWNDAWKVVTGALASVIPAGAAIVALSSWLGKVWAGKLMQADCKHRPRKTSSRLEHYCLDKGMSLNDLLVSVIQDFWSKESR